MKRFVFILFILQGLGSFAQSFLWDGTFQPFFNIRNQFSPKPAVYDIIENSFDDKVYVVGAIDQNFNSTPYKGVVSYYRNGSLNTNFSVNNSLLKYVQLINDTTFYLSSGSGLGGILDTTSISTSLNYLFGNNAIKSVRCDQAIPFFFPDGSSLFGNSSDNTGQPCPIINPPDTFPGRHIIKLTPTGLWDSTFTGDANAPPEGFVRYDSTRILIFGVPTRFSHYNGIPINGLCRVFLDGTLDTSFTSPLSDTTKLFVGYPSMIEKNGKIFLTGNFHLKGYPQEFTLVRLNADGSLDTSFANFSGPTESNFFSTAFVSSVVKTEDGGYLVGGFFDSYQGHYKPSIAKIDSNGWLQNQYFNGTGPDSSLAYGPGRPVINKILRSKFGGYYVGGDFRRWDGIPCQPIVRIYGLPVGLNEKDNQLPEVSIFPNPSQGIFQITAPEKIASVQVLNLLGQEIKFENKPSAQIDLSGIDSGVYFVNLQLKEGLVITKKIIKQ